MRVRGKISPRVAGWFGILGPFITLSLIAVAIHLYPGFSFADNNLSDLGSRGAPYGYTPIFNLGVALGGVSILIFSLGLSEIFRTRLGVAGTWLLRAAAIAIILVALFPADVPRAEHAGIVPSAVDRMHSLCAVVTFACLPLSLLIFGIDRIRLPEERLWGALVIFPLIVSGVAIASIYLAIPYDVGNPIPAIIGGAAVYGLFVTFGIRLIRS